MFLLMAHGFHAELDGQPAGWLSYGLARLATGDKSGAEYALQQGLAAASGAEVINRWPGGSTDGAAQPVLE
jgi:hypothetical protein